jgi:hypothetical protein
MTTKSKGNGKKPKQGQPEIAKQLWLGAYIPPIAKLRDGWGTRGFMAGGG